MNRSFSKIRHIQEANAKLERRKLKEQQGTTDTVSTDTTSTDDKIVNRTAEMRNKMADMDETQSLPDCFEYIRNNARVSQSDADKPGSSPKLTNVDIEYFRDGGPSNTGVAIIQNGRRACWTKTQ